MELASDVGTSANVAAHTPVAGLTAAWRALVSSRPANDRIEPTARATSPLFTADTGTELCTPFLASSKLPVPSPRLAVLG